MFTSDQVLCDEPTGINATNTNTGTTTVMPLFISKFTHLSATFQRELKGYVQGSFRDERHSLHLPI